MEIPKLKINQYAVGKAQFSTGIVLRNDGTIFKNGESLDKMYEIFESYAEAESFARNKINEDPAIECWIVNSSGQRIITFDKDGKRKYKT